jgi:hypothetical protein
MPSCTAIFGRTTTVGSGSPLVIWLAMPRRSHGWNE